MPQASIFDQQVLPLFEATREDWLRQARQEAKVIAADRGEVTADDVRDRLPPPEGVDPRVMGAIFRPASEWELVRYERSSRATCHNRPIGVFRLKPVQVRQS